MLTALGRVGTKTMNPVIVALMITKKALQIYPILRLEVGESETCCILQSDIPIWAEQPSPFSLETTIMNANQC